MRADTLETLSFIDEKAVLVDLGDQPQQALAELEPRLESGKLMGFPLVVVGPDDAFDQMSRTIELGIAAYVPRSKLQK